MISFLIIGLIILVYLIYIIWTWYNLGFMPKSKKVAFIIAGSLIIYVITLIIFNISKQGINIQNIEIENIISNILIFIFTALNCIIVIPIIARYIDKLSEKEIEKNKFKKAITIIVIIFIIIAIFEIGYIKDTIEGIINIYKSLGV